jgi:hypothetical protein
VQEQPDSPEQPILRLGIAGFTPGQYRAIERGTEQASGLSEWCISSFAEADAWVVNGAHVKFTADGILRVAPGRPTEQTIKLDPAEVDRPVAFALPLAAPQIEPLCTFDAESVSSVQATLRQFEVWLRHARVLFALGREVVRYGPELRHGIFHVSNADKLLAVLDFRRGRAGVSPHAHPADLANARWDKRATGAGDVPDSFMPTSPAELAWAYARRSRNELLPTRYTEQALYFRGPPKVPTKWLSDSQLMLLRELASEPSDFAGLQERTGVPAAQLVQDMTCLFFAGSITTSVSKASRSMPLHEPTGPDSSGTDFEPLANHGGRTAPTRDRTAPASLRFWRGEG